MTERCDSTSRRPRDYSSTEASSCEPTREEAAGSQVAAQQAAEREAEARRNAYFTSGTDEGGRSKHAASDGSVMASFTADDKNARILANATKYDRPIESDPLGNALVGIAAGGIIGGVEAGVGKVGLAGVRGMFMQPISRELVKDAIVGEASGAAAFAKGAATGAASTAVKAARNAAIFDGVPAAARALVDASNAAGATTSESVRTSSSSSSPAPSVAGQSSKEGASVPVQQPDHSQPPRIPEVLYPSMLRIDG